MVRHVDKLLQANHEHQNRMSAMATDTQPLPVEIVSDVVCPWCVIGYRQLLTASNETGIPIEVTWRPFELNPTMVEEGENLREHLHNKYGTTLEGSIKARARLTALGAELGFTFNYADDMRMWNTFRAHQLIAWAEEQGRGHDMKQALFGAFFTHRRNLADIDVLVAEAGAIGLDAADAKQALTTESHAQNVREREALSHAQGINGVPAMIFNGRHLVVGARGVETYTQVLSELSRAKVA